MDETELLDAVLLWADKLEKKEDYARTLLFEASKDLEIIRNLVKEIKHRSNQ